MREAVTAVFGVLVIVGGVIGYTKARSIVSLVSGIGCGGLLLYAAYLILGSRAYGIPIAAIVSALLAMIFCLRWVKTKKFMPSGVLLILSLVELIILFALPK
jgi:uncharacterized membrane protein (UPF0136 family)